VDPSSIPGQGLITKGDEAVYRHAVGELVEWCDTNHLNLNVGKTKELVVDFRRSRSAIDPIIIKGQPVEIVGHYKYLGSLGSWTGLPTLTPSPRRPTRDGSF
jgi:hypothetical protein